MSSRLATRLGLPAPEDRLPGAMDLVRFHEPATGSLARTKGSLFLLAQLTGGDAHLARAAGDALEQLQHDYYYDLSAGSLGALAKALANANRRLYHQRGRLGIPRRAGVSIIAMAIRGREAHVAKLGPAAAVILREGRMYELPPPPAVDEEDPRVRQRRVAATLGEALEITPYTWKGELAPGDQMALVSRNLAQVVGVDELKHALATLRPSAAVEHVERLFQIRGGSGSDGILAIEIVELPATATTRQLEPVRPAEPLAGLPDQSPVPLADAIGRFLHRMGDAIDGLQGAVGRAILYAFNVVFAFVPRRRPQYPRQVLRTAAVEEGRRRRLGMLGMAGVALLLAFGTSVASLPAVSPTQAIPARRGRPPGDRGDARPDGPGGREGRWPRPDRPCAGDRHRASESGIRRHRECCAGRRAGRLRSNPLRDRVDAGLDRIYAVARIGEASTLVDLATPFPGISPSAMVAASDGSLWVADTGRGRLVRIDGRGRAQVVYRAGQAIGELAAGDPWLLATAATDVVLVDRQRQAWRFDLREHTPQPLSTARAGRGRRPQPAAGRAPASAAAGDLQPVRGRRGTRRGAEVDARRRDPGRATRDPPEPLPRPSSPDLPAARRARPVRGREPVAAPGATP